MTEQRFISVQFCDDVRAEVGNKFSLMGCYGPSMVLGAMPTVLPKLCANIKIYSPIDQPIERLAVKILRGEEILAEVSVPPEILFSALTLERPLGASRQLIGCNLVIAPFPIEETCALRVEADTGDEVLNGGLFRIDRAPLQT